MRESGCHHGDRRALGIHLVRYLAFALTLHDAILNCSMSHSSLTFASHKPICAHALESNISVCNSTPLLVAANLTSLVAHLTICTQLPRIQFRPLCFKNSSMPLFLSRCLIVPHSLASHNSRVSVPLLSSISPCFLGEVT